MFDVYLWNKIQVFIKKVDDLLVLKDIKISVCFCCNSCICVMEVYSKIIKFILVY